jgi:hypothetical protein
MLYSTPPAAGPTTAASIQLALNIEITRGSWPSGATIGGIARIAGA